MCTCTPFLRGLAEQQEVEQFFLNYGAFIKSYHDGYWVGLTSTASTWPKFAWLDFLVPPPVNGSGYVHWAAREPNNEYAPETCGLANSTVTYGGAWGWQDSSCYRCGAQAVVCGCCDVHERVHAVCRCAGPRRCG
jgi:hypothetical protein